MQKIYLDHNATTPPLPEVLSLLQTLESSSFGNPSSIHWAGREARKLLNHSRMQIAQLLGAQETEILFTSGGTESINTALVGVWESSRQASTFKNQIITTPVEHHATLRTLEFIQSKGAELIFLKVDAQGRIDPNELAEKIGPHTLLVSVMAANNELGNLYPIGQIGALCRERNVLFHCDAVQTVAKQPIHLEKMPIDLMSFSGHKFHGPKGIGGLYLRRGVSIFPLHRGGLQERQLRAGTENVAAIAGMAKAIELGLAHLPEDSLKVARLRGRLEEGIISRLSGVYINGDVEHRLANTTNLFVEGVDGESLLFNLDLFGVAASAGAACESGSIDPSHVLLAMGFDEKRAKSSVRFSLSKLNTEDEIDFVTEELPKIVKRLRK